MRIRVLYLLHSSLSKLFENRGKHLENMSSAQAKRTGFSRTTCLTTAFNLLGNKQSGMA
jgi:hypothetical protein